SGVGLAGSAALVVGGDAQPGLGDGGAGGGLSQCVIGSIGAAQTQSRDVDGLGRADILVRKGAGGAGGVKAQSVTTDEPDQGSTGGIEAGAGGGVIDLVIGGDAR